jgi:phage gp46-like protein
MGAALTFASGRGDLALGPAGLEQDQGLVTLVLISLLSDARARAEDLAAAGRSPKDRDLRGWWADSEQDRFGSRLWMLDRAKQTPQTLARANDYARDALAWMVREGICERVEVESSFPSHGVLHVRVRIVRGRASQWPSLWEQPVSGFYQQGSLSLEIV